MRNSNGVTTIILTLSQDTTSVTQVTFNQTYSTNIPDDSDLLIRFDSTRVSIVNGCNVQSANYKAFSNGTIIF